MYSNNAYEMHLARAWSGRFRPLPIERFTALMDACITLEPRPGRS